MFRLIDGGVGCCFPQTAADPVLVLSLCRLDIFQVRSMHAADHMLAHAAESELHNLPPSPTNGAAVQRRAFSGRLSFSLQSCDSHIVELRGSREQTDGLQRCVDIVKGKSCMEKYLFLRSRG